MNTNRRPQALISNGSRFAAALVVAGFVSAVCATAAHESRYAVEESSAAMSRGTTIYVQLPTVEIVARREAASAVAASNVHRAARTL